MFAEALLASSIAEVIVLLIVSESTLYPNAAPLAIVAGVVMGLVAWTPLRGVAKNILAEAVRLLGLCPPSCPRRYLIVFSRAVSALRLVEESGPLLAATLSLATLPLESLLYAASRLICSEGVVYAAERGYAPAPPPPSATLAGLVLAASAGLASPLIGYWLEHRVLPCIRALSLILEEA